MIVHYRWWYSLRTQEVHISRTIECCCTTTKPKGPEDKKVIEFSYRGNAIGLSPPVPCCPAPSSQNGNWPQSCGTKMTAGRVTRFHTHRKAHKDVNGGGEVPRNHPHKGDQMNGAYCWLYWPGPSINKLFARRVKCGLRTRIICTIGSRAKTLFYFATQFDSNL